MSLEKPANERLELYEAFKKALKEGNDDVFFDADDLVAIIDQAVDLSDEYVQIEALMRGYRYFADNEELAIRRGFLFYDLNLREGIDNSLAAPTPHTSPLWHILRLRSLDEEFDSDRARHSLDELLATTDELDDETVIQLVDCASAAGIYDWLKQNEKTLRAKAGYLPSLLYELYIVSGLNDDRPFGLKLLEELTEIEPFNIDFWIALGSEHLANRNYDDALAAADFALAIDAENSEALNQKATALLNLEMNSEAEALLKPYAETESTDNPAAAVLYARLLAAQGKTAEAIGLLTRWAEIIPADVTLHDLLLRLRVNGLEEILKRHFKAVVNSDLEAEAHWTERAMVFYNDGDFFEAAMLLKTLNDLDSLPDDKEAALASALYGAGLYAAGVSLLTDRLADASSALTPEVCVGGLLAICHTGTKADVKAMFKAVTARFPLILDREWTIGSTLASIGFSTFLGLLNAQINSPGPIDIDEIEIFHPRTATGQQS